VGLPLRIAFALVAAALRSIRTGETSRSNIVSLVLRWIAQDRPKPAEPEPISLM
jgi:hypothetical protein